jgi:hypothetical protein
MRLRSLVLAAAFAALAFTLPAPQSRGDAAPKTEPPAPVVELAKVSHTVGTAVEFEFTVYNVPPGGIACYVLILGTDINNQPYEIDRVYTTVGTEGVFGTGVPVSVSPPFYHTWGSGFHYVGVGFVGIGAGDSESFTNP